MVSDSSFDIVYLTKQEIIYKELHEGLLAGRYLPGERLDLDEIAAAAGTSRTPVREAIRRLESQGAVTAIPYHGFFVAKLSIDAVIELYRIRAVLEGLAARLAATRIRESEGVSLRDLVQQMESSLEGTQSDGILELNRPFHEIIYRAAGSPLLYEYINELYVNTARYRGLAMTGHGRAVEIVVEHRALAEAVIAGEEDEAERIARAHHERNAQAVVRLARQSEE